MIFIDETIPQNEESAQEQLDNIDSSNMNNTDFNSINER